MRDRDAHEQKRWTNLLLENAKQAKRAGQLSAHTDPATLTLELSTMLTGADLAFLLLEDPNVLRGSGLPSAIDSVSDRPPVSRTVAKPSGAPHQRARNGTTAASAVV